VKIVAADWLKFHSSDLYPMCISDIAGPVYVRLGMLPLLLVFLRRALRGRHPVKQRNHNISGPVTVKRSTVAQPSLLEEDIDV
jgi:hypothetical protein